MGTELNRTALSFAERWKTAIEKVRCVHYLDFWLLAQC